MRATVVRFIVRAPCNSVRCSGARISCSTLGVLGTMPGEIRPLQDKPDKTDDGDPKQQAPYDNRKAAHGVKASSGTGDATRRDFA
jgi:hypothetical protein